MPAAMGDLDPRALALLLGLVIGVAFGAVARWSGFCVRGAVEDALSRPDAPRLRGYLVAAIVALIGVEALAAAGAVDLGKTIYLSGAVPLGGAVLGGLMFGSGMVLTGGCGARLLVLAAGGNLRALVALLVMGLVSYATLRGILAPPRQSFGAATGVALATADQSLPTILARLTGLSATIARWLMVALLAVPALLFVLRRRVEARHLVGGALIGLLVPAGFAATGIVGADEFQPMNLESITVTGPWAQTIIYLLTYTGAALEFGIVWALGIPVGAALVALARGEMKLEGFDGAAATGRYISGGVLMGIGGVLALGCTIGQGLSGVSTLSLGSLLAFASIFAGAAATMKWRARRVAAAR
ncbi:MAG: YeeE/YedE family protein [Alphaproteobacteria bacterium]|nr:YeeE/YedE family protein [Alphaproteobacteria bacterium]